MKKHEIIYFFVSTETGIVSCDGDGCSVRYNLGSSFAPAEVKTKVPDNRIFFDEVPDDFMEKTNTSEAKIFV